MKKLGFIKVFFAAMVAMVVVWAEGCVGDGSLALAGKWVPESGQRVPADFIERRAELSKDGTGIGDGYTLTWTATKDRLTFKLDAGYGFAYNYKISGSTLILTNDDGINVKYKKE